MIHEALNILRNKLEEYLDSVYGLPEGHVMLGSIPSPDEDMPNKLVFSVINIERESAMGISRSYQQVPSGNLVGKFPPWHLNIDIMLASIFDGKQYEESLKMLSYSIGYLQQHTCFVLSGGKQFTIEMITSNTQELTNIWSMFGGRYYPSVLLKIRMLTYDGDEISSTTRKVTTPGVDVKF